MGVSLSEITTSDAASFRQMEQLLRRAGLRLDKNLDYSCGLFDESGRLLATGSCFGCTLRCLAVDPERRGEGLLNLLVTHLVERLVERGVSRVFLCTKAANSPFFRELGFYEIVRSSDGLCFMENRRGAFSGYLQRLSLNRSDGRSAAVVMHANPFTLGHRYLLERAAAENDRVFLFLLSEESGPIPFSVRRQLVRRDIADLDKVVCLDSGPYMISSSTFPSYFLPDEDDAILAHAGIDLQVFLRVAEALGIRSRYVGEEKSSHVTAVYNRMMHQLLPPRGVEVHEIPRLTRDGVVVSASSVRQAIHDGDADTLRLMLSEASLRYWESAEAAPVVEAIRRMASPRHH